MLAAPTEVQLKAPLPSVFNTCPSSPSPSGKVKVTSAVTSSGAFKATVLDPSPSFSMTLLAFPTVTSPVAVMAAPLILPVVITTPSPKFGSILLPEIAALELTSAFTITPPLMLVAPAVSISTSPLMLTAAPLPESLPTMILPAATSILSAVKLPAVMLAAPPLKLSKLFHEPAALRY